ncbi:TIGR03862 family flavoprotein [Undibacterium sp.]|uniref:TIGR03862 family flavoprotein n=1 Tax=Undibacterium sp. TaxID=1914977 RepID=UPI00374DE737
MTGKTEARTVAVIGGGPAGLMAAETIAAQGLQVDVYDAMPSVGRKFLLAGKGGMNLTHSEPQAAFVQRYGNRSTEIAELLKDFAAQDVRRWAEELGIATFIGSSGRVFPTDMKAAPLLRAWLHRIRERGVRFHMRHRWIGWKDGALLFASPEGELLVRADATVLALGGGSWARLGSDAAWVPLLEQRQVEVAPLQPANCGFDVGWSEHFRQRHAGQPLTSVIAHVTDVAGTALSRQGQFVITEGGVEGSLIYALSAPLRELIAAEGQAVLQLDLAPGKSQQRVDSEVMHPRGSRSWSSHLQGRLGLDGLKTSLLRECLPAEYFQQPELLSRAVKALPVVLRAPRPIDEAISSEGGVTFSSMDPQLMLHALPGVFCAGEMLDWEAPTGGYLLTACFAAGKRAGDGVLQWLENQK